VPSARGEKLHSTDQKLLRSPVQLDESDLFPSDQDPRFLVQPPVPSLGAHGETYAEGVGGGRRFRKTMGADGERLLTSASAVADAQALRLPAISPLAGTQAAFFLMGVCFHGSAGVVAGLSLAQSLASPGFGKATLTMHMAYASVALVLQRATNALGLFAFIGATDRHLGARTWSSGVVVCLCAPHRPTPRPVSAAHPPRVTAPATHPPPSVPPPPTPYHPVADGFYAMLVAMQLPVDAVLHDGRRERVPAMLAHLLAAGDDPELLRLDDTTAFPEVRHVPACMHACTRQDANPSSSFFASMHASPLLRSTHVLVPVASPRQRLLARSRWRSRRPRRTSSSTSRRSRARCSTTTRC